MPERVSMRFDPLTLSNVAGGALEEQFQDHLAQVASVFQVPNDGEIPWELSKSKAAAKVTLELTFTHDFKIGMTVVEAHTSIRPPKRKGVARSVLIRDGAVLTEPSGDQLDLIQHIREREGE